MKTKTLRLSGTLELFGNEFENRDHIVQVLKNVYKKFGFDPLQTPAIEKSEVFSGYHGEGEKLLFKLQDKSGENIVLRYDLTVPFARFAVENPQINRPIKRYQMQMSYRDDAVDKGHFREFMQCDGDIIGSQSLHYDAEIICLACDGLTSLGFKNYTIRVNHRAIIKGIAEEMGFFDEAGLLRVQRALDCADKFGKAHSSKDDFRIKLEERNFKETEINYLIDLVYTDYSLNNIDALTLMLSNNSNVLHGVKELKEIFSYLPRGILHHCHLDLTLARGADYYTGFILEGVIDDSGVGAVLGGGRFDSLVRDFGGTDYGCVGMAFGLDRLFVVMNNRKMFQENYDYKILVASSIGIIDEDLKMVAKLRSERNIVDHCCEFNDLEKYINYAKSRNFSEVIYQGKRHILKKC